MDTSSIITVLNRREITRRLDIRVESLDVSAEKSGSESHSTQDTQAHIMRKIERL